MVCFIYIDRYPMRKQQVLIGMSNRVGHVICGKFAQNAIHLDLTTSTIS